MNHSRYLWRMSLFCAASLCWFPVAHSYAAWLKCYVELDPSEVIMHHKVQAAPLKDKDATVRLQVRATQDQDWTSSLQFELAADAPTAVDQDDSLLHYWQIQVRLEVPRTLGNEVNWVVQVQNGDNLEEWEADFASFAGPTSVCEGRRAHATRADTILTLAVPVGTLTHTSHLQLVAGWAPGMEAVTLTPVLKIHLPEFALHPESERDEL